MSAPTAIPENFLDRYLSRRTQAGRCKTHSVPAIPPTRSVHCTFSSPGGPSLPSLPDEPLPPADENLNNLDLQAIADAFILNTLAGMLQATGIQLSDAASGDKSEQVGA